MREEDLKYFSGFLKEFQEETDRGAALVGAALIDERIERLLNAHFLRANQSNEILNGSNAPHGRSYMGIERSTFIFDKKGTLRHEFRGVKVPEHVDQVLDAVKQR